MSKFSGGVIAGNFREGFRSEGLAQYVFSAFGPSILVNREDFGLDILCNMAKREGPRLFVKYAYAVQVKSGNEPFTFTGPQVFQWLSNIEYPLLLAEVLKHESIIKIYSTWNLNHLLLFVDPAGNVPETIECITDEEVGIIEQVDGKYTGKVTIGKPILEFNIMDLGDNKKRNTYWKILGYWVEFDSRNILNRRAGLPVVYGIKNWTTNDLSHFEFQLYYTFNPYLNKKAIDTFTKAAIEIGLFQKKASELNPGNAEFKRKFNDIRSVLLKDFINDLGEFGKGVFANELI